MNATLKKLTPAFVAIALILAWAMGYGTSAQVRGAGTPAERQQVAALIAERDRALAELADSRKRHQIACKSIERFADELAYVDEANESLTREKASMSDRLSDYMMQWYYLNEANKELQREIALCGRHAKPGTPTP
jgi:hypothetical protein